VKASHYLAERRRPRPMVRAPNRAFTRTEPWPMPTAPSRFTATTAAGAARRWRVRDRHPRVQPRHLSGVENTIH